MLLWITKHIRRCFICILFICRFHTLHITLLNTVMEVFTLQENLFFLFKKRKEKKNTYHLCLNVKRKKKKHNFLANALQIN